MDKYTFETHPLANPASIIQGPTYRFTLLSEKLIRFEWAEDGVFEDRASTFAINRSFPVPSDFRVVDKEHDLQIITSHFHLEYTKEKFSPQSLVFHFGGKSTKYGTPWRFGTPTAFNLGGTARTLDEVDGRCDMGTGVLSKAGYAVIDDSQSMLFDGKGFVAPRQSGERYDFYLFCYGREYKEAIKALYAVSGNQPIVPRYVLGNWWSRYYAYHQDEYVGLMDQFRDHGIPMSVAVIDMDWHYVADDRVPHAGWTGYTWNEKLFPDPKKFRHDLHERLLKISLNDHPHAGVHAHEDAYDEMAWFLGHDTSDNDPILFDPTNPKFMEAYFNILHRNLEGEACDLWWVDWQQGPFSKIPGFDPLWLLNHFQYLDSGRDGRRALTFSRYGGPGSHRYPIGFSGDTVVSWDSLAFQPEFTATASNIGYGWWSHDIGGHLRGVRDDELLVRWTQLGVFSPVMRLHSTSSRWMSKEPWLYGDECSKVMASFLSLRHRLVPYLYTQNVQGSANGEPLVRPMYWSYPDQNNAYEVPNQYFLGSSLLVAPIVQPRDRRTNLASVSAWLPPSGRFVDIMTGTIYDGGRGITFYRPIDEYPVLAPEGSIITLDGATTPRNGCLNPESVEVFVVVGRDGEDTMIEDSTDVAFHDEREPGLQHEKQEQKIVFLQDQGQLTANLSKGRKYTFRFIGMTATPAGFKVSIDGQLTDVNVTVTQYPDLPCLTVDVPGQTSASSLVIKLGSSPRLAVIDHTLQLEGIIRGYQIEFRMKDRLWACIVDGKSSPLGIVSSLLSLGNDEAIIGPLIELISADSRASRSGGAVE